MTKRPIMVTGASGFFGRHLVPYLEEQGYVVHAADRSGGCDVLDPASLARLPEFETLIHLAARTFVPASYEETTDFFRVNVIGTLNCLELCRRRKAAFVFPGTYVYGRPDYLPIDEVHPVRAWNPYATSKIMGEELCRSYAHSFGVRACVLRFFNLYGADQAEHYLVPTIVSGLREGQLELQSSRPKRDFVYVRDAAAAVAACLRSMPPELEIFNVGSGRSHSVIEVVDTLQGLLGTAVEVNYLGQSRPGEVLDTVADCEKIRRTLGWEPRYSLKEGLADLLQH